MFKFLTQRFRDMDRLTRLFNEAERIANAEGQAEPGAEHMVMAALTSPDDESARRALAQQGATPEAFSAAVQQQYANALKSIGIEAPLVEQQDLIASPPVRKRGFYKATESMHDLLDAMTTNKEFTSKTAFSAAEILLGATRPKFGVVARAFDLLGIDRDDLASAARVEIAGHTAG